MIYAGPPRFFGRTWPRGVQILAPVLPFPGSWTTSFGQISYPLQISPKSAKYSSWLCPGSFVAVRWWHFGSHFYVFSRTIKRSYLTGYRTVARSSPLPVSHSGINISSIFDVFVQSHLAFHFLISCVVLLRETKILDPDGSPKRFGGGKNIC